jgi:hypothetical protein
MQSRWLQFIGVAVVCLGLAALPAASRAHAQGKPVAADFKGAVGLGLVGAELGAVVPALAGADAAWAYVVFPIVGAAGGAVAGYFAIDRPGHVELSVAALTVGMALVIPALVITLWATAYDPDSDAVDSGQARSTGHAVNQRRANTLSARAQKRIATASAGSGVVRLADGELRLATPGVALVPSVQRGEMRLSGVSVSLLSGRF